MKRYYILFLTVLLVILLAGCSSGGTTSESESSETSSTESSDNIDADQESMNSEGSSKILIAYFSQTGNTQIVAEDISADINANLFQILPVEPYTQDDLDHNDQSRSKIESEDTSARPQINGTVENMNEYTTILLGYPIWYGIAPRIIDTFLESYDFSGKTIIPFCTSGSSSIDESVTELKALAPNATWEAGMRFSEQPTDQEVTDWVNSLNLN